MARDMTAVTILMAFIWRYFSLENANVFRSCGPASSYVTSFWQCHDIANVQRHAGGRLNIKLSHCPSVVVDSSILTQKSRYK